MSAKIKKIRPDIESTPQMILGMLNGHSSQIKHIAAVIVWDDDSYQLVNDVMTKRDLAFALAIFQREFFEDL